MMQITAILAFSCIILFAGIYGCSNDSPRLSDSAKKVNPKLGSPLNELVQAEKRGEAGSFARQRNIELIDGKVRVIIESVPGRFEDTSKGVAILGTIETRSDDLLQMLVPVSNLEALSALESVKFIRLPQRAVPAVSFKGVGRA